MKAIDPVSLAVLLAILALLPLLFVVTSCFLKISVVMMIVRNALGVQQVPPNIALYGLSLLLSLYVMSPVFTQMTAAVRTDPATLTDVRSLFRVAEEGAAPLRQFLNRHASEDQRNFFLGSVRKLWPPEQSEKVSEKDFLILMPAFVTTELTKAFEIGFLLYLPFVVIDLVVSNILLSLGMMMVSPSMISLPLKLLLFVLIDGWTKLIHGLILSYA